MVDSATLEAIRRADIANTKPVSGCADCGGDENPHYVERIEILDEPTVKWTKGWLCKRCQDRNRKMDLESTTRVIGCHRCGGGEYAARSFTLMPKAWLCHKCVDQVSENNSNEQALLDYIADTMRSARGD